MKTALYNSGMFKVLESLKLDLRNCDSTRKYSNNSEVQLRDASPMK